MIRMALEIRYTGDVTLKYSARCFNVWLPLNAAIVPGTMMSDWAKMIGITLRSEEHTSELQSRLHLVCRLLLEQKNQHLGAVRSGAGDPAEGNNPLLPAQPLRRRQAVWLLDHRQLPRGLRPICLQRHPVQHESP